MLSIHYAFGTAHERVRLDGGLEERKANAATKSHWTFRPEVIIKDSHIYNDMRRIRIEALLLYVKE